jgi:hypothetical protein
LYDQKERLRNDYSERYNFPPASTKDVEKALQSVVKVDSLLGDEFSFPSTIGPDVVRLILSEKGPTRQIHYDCSHWDEHAALVDQSALDIQLDGWLSVYGKDIIKMGRGFEKEYNEGNSRAWELVEILGERQPPSDVPSEDEGTK